MKESILARLEKQAEQIATKNNLKVTTVMKDDGGYRIDFEEKPKEDRKAGFK